MGHEFKFEVISLDVMAEETSSSKIPTVLVVDDEPLIVDSLAAILANAGLNVAKAYGGQQALELAMANPPDLLLTDVAMPDLNGIDLAMAVAASHPECRVLLFSGHASSRDLVEARQAGYDFQLLNKPLHPKEMLKQVFLMLNGDPSRSTKTTPLRDIAQWQMPQFAM